MALEFKKKSERIHLINAGGRFSPLRSIELVFRGVKYFGHIRYFFMLKMVNLWNLNRGGCRSFLIALIQHRDH